jgi:phosphoglycolate phosphatase-like HAD superfamily hydrolase
MWSTHLVSAVYASLIAVAGTLLGSVSTYVFQRQATARAEASARQERVRQDRLAACSEFAAAVTKLKSGVVAAWLQRDDQDKRDAAFADADRLGSPAEAALFRLVLVSGRPEPLAQAAFDFLETLRGASDLSLLKAAEADFEAKVFTFIEDASKRLVR